MGFADGFPSLQSRRLATHHLTLDVKVPRRLFACLYFRNGERPSDLFGAKSDLVPFLKPVEHRQVLHSKHHGHGWHVEVLQRTVLDRDLARAFVDFAYFTFAHRRSSGGWLRIRMMRVMVSAGLGREWYGEQSHGHGEYA